MYTYKIVEKKENDLETVIEKGNLTTRFTIQDIKDHLAFTEKTLRETKAQLEAEKIQDKIALEILPLLKEVPSDKWNVVLMYANRQVQRPVSESLIETSEATIKSYTEQLEIIKKDLGLSDESHDKPEEKIVEVE